MSNSNRASAFVVFSALLFSLALLSFTLFTNAFAVTGGGNITNLSNMSGGVANITGAGYYYLVRGSSGSLGTGDFINYTNATQDAGISIESGNVTVDCHYPSLGRIAIAGANNTPANVVGGIVVNATRGIDSMQNVTIRNCLFTNFSSVDGAGIIVNGNVTGLHIYNNTFNDSRFGIIITSNGTSGLFGGTFTNVNISTNTFFNITTRGTLTNSRAIVFDSHVILSSVTNPISVVNSTIIHNNFTEIGGIGGNVAILVYNASNLTVYNNTVYNSDRGFHFGAINNSNISNNNLSYIYTRLVLGAIGLYNTSVGTSIGDLSSVPNTVANNWIFNVSVGVGLGTGIETNLSNINFTANTVNYTDTGINIGTDVTGSSYYSNLVRNVVGNATGRGIVMLLSPFTKLLGNVIRDSQIGIKLALGSNSTTLINNSITNVPVGFDVENAFTISSQDDDFHTNNNATFFLANANVTAVNISANVSNITLSHIAGGITNLNVLYPVNVTATDASNGTVLAGGSLTVVSGASLPSDLASTLFSSSLDGSGTTRFNVSVFRARNNSDGTATLQKYNDTAHSFTVAITGYVTKSITSTLPTGTQGAELGFLIPLTAVHTASSTGASGAQSTNGGSDGANKDTGKGTTGGGTTDKPTIEVIKDDPVIVDGGDVDEVIEPPIEDEPPKPIIDISSSSSLILALIIMLILGFLGYTFLRR